MGGGGSKPAPPMAFPPFNFPKPQPTAPQLPVTQPAPILPAAINFVQAQNPPTPDPAAVCAANKITLNSLQSQVDQTSNAVDSCDPSKKVERLTKQYIKENQDFVQQQQAQFSELDQSIKSRFKTSNDLVESIHLLKQFDAELKDQKSAAEKESVGLINNERAYRRDFLDTQPEEGVPWHVVGLQTADDKAMLAFWISTSVFLSLLATLYIRTYRAGAGLWANVGVGLGIVLLPLLTSYFIIVYHG
jgi:hypothetical protein